MRKKGETDVKRLCGKLRAKLRDKAGETLVETLVTIIICVFASVMFAGAVAASSRLNQNAHLQDEEFQGDLILLETVSEVSEADGTVRIAGDEVSGTVDVVRYEQGDFHTYQVVND